MKYRVYLHFENRKDGRDVEREKVELEGKKKEIKYRRRKKG
jgi:hypothetical protein